MGTSRPNATVTCQRCGTVQDYYLRPAQPPKRYCGQRCAQLSQKGNTPTGESSGKYVPRVPVVCEICGTVRMFRPKEAALRKHCSNKCRGAAMANSVDLYRVDPETGCWVWQRFTDDKGYARVSIGTKRELAHRWMYERERGSIPADYELHHGCENPSCVNPDHMEPLTESDHKRRHRLSDETVRSIRALAASLNQTEIASRFGVDPSSVSRIVRREEYADVA